MRGADVGWRDHLVGAALACLALWVLLATAPDLGLARDESYYVSAAKRYAGWFERLAADPEAAMQRKVIDDAWRENREHPPLIKSLFAFSWLADRKWSLFDARPTAFRFPAMVLSALTLWLLYVFGARAFGRAAGLFAAGAFALLPRVFYHAHLCAFDMPIVFMITWVTYLYWRSLRHPAWCLALGVAFGLALATKHNSWIVPGVLLIHWMWVAVAVDRDRRLGPDTTAGVRVAPWWAIGMLALGPVVAWSIWPWMWHDTLDRFKDYATFHLKHEHYTTAYFGVSYWRPPFPASVPWVLTAYTVPVTTLALMLLGAAGQLRAIIADWIPGRWRAAAMARGRPDPRRTAVLLFGSALAPLVVISMPESPIFGGTKHWITGYPFACLLAGAAFARLCAGVTMTWRAPRLATAALGAALLAPAALETAHSHPHGLAHYTMAAGYTPGAADRGMLRGFWGFSTGAVVPWLTDALPEGGTVWLNDSLPTSLTLLHADGSLPRSIRPTSSIARADMALVHHEPHFKEVDAQIWTIYDDVTPAHVHCHDGVPLISVYGNPMPR